MTERILRREYCAIILATVLASWLVAPAAHAEDDDVQYSTSGATATLVADLRSDAEARRVAAQLALSAPPPVQFESARVEPSFEACVGAVNGGAGYDAPECSGIPLDITDRGPVSSNPVPLAIPPPRIGFRRCRRVRSSTMRWRR